MLRAVSLENSYLASLAGGPHVSLTVAQGPFTIENQVATTSLAEAAMCFDRAGGNLAAGDGVSIHLRLNSSAAVKRDALRVTAEWATATDGAESADVVFASRVAGVPTEVLRFLGSDVRTSAGLEIDGTLDHDGANAGFFGATPVAQPAHIVDADGTLADVTTKLNALLAQVAVLGLQAAT